MAPVANQDEDQIEDEAEYDYEYYDVEGEGDIEVEGYGSMRESSTEYLDVPQSQTAAPSIQSNPSLRGLYSRGRATPDYSDDSESSREKEHTVNSKELIADILEDSEPRSAKSRPLDTFRPAEFVYPLSHYDDYIPPLPPSKEQDVVEEFLKEIAGQKRNVNNTDGEEDFIEFELSNFSIYLPHSVKHYPGTLTGLQTLATKPSSSWYCFDGILSLGAQRRYVQGVPFKVCSIGNYGREHDSVGDNLWIQSNHNHGSEVYYRLKAPSAEFSRYHDGFLWLSDLGKHFVDYSEWIAEQDRRVSIHNFREHFTLWLQNIHGRSETYQKWYERYNRNDFRPHIVANIDFLWKETFDISRGLSKQPIWREVKLMEFVPKQKLRAKGTIVTSYVYDCFRHLKFGGELVKIDPSNNVKVRRKSLGKALHLTMETPTKIINTPKRLEKESIAVGDVLAVPMDDESVALWKDEPSKWKPADECWYVLVQGIHESRHSRSFDVIWLYKPSDTTCAMMRYPYSNELFLSDNCSCNHSRITEEEVLYKVAVAWHGQPSCQGLFVRQTYLRSNAFISLQDSHKKCVHLRDELKTPLEELVDLYQVGDTVLFVPPQQPSRHGLEPGEILGFIQEGTEGYVKIRCLHRRCELDGNGSTARPNELVYTDRTVTMKASSVKRKCFVRFYRESVAENRTIPTPYDRDGTGNVFYIRTRLIGSSLEPIYQSLPQSLRQGVDFNVLPVKARLRGLDLYCGGGNFGRGLEEGGAIHMTHAVDYNQQAIHSYYANLKDPKSTKLYYGSVNDMLLDALKGNALKSDLIPLPGDIDFISAGSPCPGFSVLNSNRNNAKGLRDQSLVASVAAYIDVYRPKYALLENVVTMAQKGKGRDEDVLSQLICCIVGMGYQVQVFNLDAWSFGSPQSRSRLFVSIAAPGLEPAPHPSLTHTHPDNTNDRGLGKMANGQSFGERHFEPTPFEFLSASEATKDLPNIGDGGTNQCIQHPDHRMPTGISAIIRAQIQAIPMRPYGMNFSKTWESGKMTPAQRLLFPTKSKTGKPRHCVLRGSRAWGRIHPKELFQTIATSTNPSCSRTGKCLHWDQQRLLTILEARRAQSFPDDEVLVGGGPTQWRIIGNSVARTVSLALGMSIAEVWVKLKPEANKTGSSRIDIPILEANLSDVSAVVDLLSGDDESLSEEQYGRSLGTLRLRSSVSHSDTTSAGSNVDLSDQVSAGIQKRPRTGSASGSLSPRKKQLLGSTSKKDRKTLWTPADDSSTASLPEETPRQARAARLPRIANSTPETIREIRAALADGPGTESSSPTKKLQADHTRRERATRSSLRTTNLTMQQRSSVSAPPPTPSNVIDLVSDDEVEDFNEDDDNDDDVVLVASVERKTRSTYVPADNSFVSAYAQTHAAGAFYRGRRA
jgi:DNA (cytosine-5)-methyltransferase 1